ncbi:MAG: prolyl-tRNA synthetase [Chloroflexi bacterium]|jgi:prolyl-tRNA synthetase|nr:MAG: prolyl-tRNA synthetase [Chloroflexota bacterium]|tara:strand:+ start:2636 stop:4378 length:1743 start_codon:yes stop_codon:yes gene_type:complete
MSKMLIPTRKESPSDSDTISHSLLIKGGYISQLLSGVYTYLPIGLRIKNKIINIIREEMNNMGCNEILMPALQPLEYWEKSKRSKAFGDIIFSILDRKKRKLILGPTHEEVVTKLFADTVNSYKQMPIIFYQIQTKFRDEARPRGGLIRVREFTMKDAYSFDIDDQALEISYEKMSTAYQKIFSRCGVPVVKIEADSGAIGGKGSQEFIYLTTSGEDNVILCDCGYAANEEKATMSIEKNKEEVQLDKEKINTKNITDIDQLSIFFKLPKNKFLKSVFYIAHDKEDKLIPIVASIRGDLEINETKLSNFLKVSNLRKMNEKEIKNYNIIAGYAGPYQLNKDIISIADESLVNADNLIGGSNELNYHLKNVNFIRDWEANFTTDLALVTSGSSCINCNKKLNSKKGIELGHIFKLGKLYSEIFNIKITNPDPSKSIPVMGCYGIGIDRILASVAENGSSNNSLTWPITISPFHVHVINIGKKEESKTMEIENSLKKISDLGIEILIDDRDETVGKKFADADLIGIPLRILFSKRNLDKNKFEIVDTTNQESSFFDIKDFEKIVIRLINNLKNKYEVEVIKN